MRSGNNKGGDVDRGDNDVAAIVEDMLEVLDDYGTNSAHIYF